MTEQELKSRVKISNAILSLALMAGTAYWMYSLDEMRLWFIITLMLWANNLRDK